MGGVLQRSQDRRSLVPTGTVTPHQLPGTPGSNTGSEMLCQRQNVPVNPTENGQYVGTHLHQQDGWDDITRTDQASERALALVHGEKHLPLSRTPPGCPEHHSGRGVQGHEGQDKLDALSPCTPSEAGPSGNRPVCDPTNNPAANIHQLETGPSSCGNECLLRELVGDEGLCQPPLEPDRESPLANPQTTSRACPDSPRMEGTTVVPSPAGNAGGNIITVPLDGGSDSANPPDQPTRGTPPTSRVGYLQERYKLRCIKDWSDLNTADIYMIFVTLHTLQFYFHVGLLQFIM